jgi:flagellar hook-basal body complex protein FliE
VTSPISSIGAINPSDLMRTNPGAGQPGEFHKVLEGTIQNLESLRTDAADSVQKFLTGENEELHSTILATERAEVAFQLGLQVRNKVISAYQEIMRMQL